MGKGDKKSRRGKIANRSFGARRPRKIKKRPTVEEKISLRKTEKKVGSDSWQSWFAVSNLHHFINL